MVSGLIFRNLIHFSFTFMYDIRQSTFILHIAVPSSQHHLLKTVFFMVYSCLCWLTIWVSVLCCINVLSCQYCTVLQRLLWRVCSRPCVGLRILCPQGPELASRICIELFPKSIIGRQTILPGATGWLCGVVDGAWHGRDDHICVC